MGILVSEETEDEVEMDQKEFNISTWRESQGPYILKAQQRAWVLTKAFGESINKSMPFPSEEGHRGSLFGGHE